MLQLPDDLGTACRGTHWEQRAASEPTLLRMRISAPPAAGPAGDRAPRAGRRSCVTRSGHTDVDMT